MEQRVVVATSERYWSTWVQEKKPAGGAIISLLFAVPSIHFQSLAIPVLQCTRSYSTRTLDTLQSRGNFGNANDAMLYSVQTITLPTLSLGNFGYAYASGCFQQS
ncbi:hypothetical protein ABKN59_009594 [Abortiporus biennis]